MLEWLAGMTVIFHELLVVISWDSIGIFDGLPSDLFRRYGQSPFLRGKSSSIIYKWT
jgi:hypothetical protein